MQPKCNVCGKETPICYGKYNADGSVIVEYCLDCAAEVCAELEKNRNGN